MITMTKLNPFRHPDRLRRSSLQFIALGLLAGFTSSCATSGKSDPSTHELPSMSRSWVKVDSKPPTWYPRGVPADHPTDFKSGEWIYAEDTKNTCFFIPLHGLPPDKRKALKAEAMAARHPETIQRINNVEIDRKAKAAGSYIVMFPFMVVGNFHP
ncbi:MAG: hypothetical protein ACJAQT_005023 [Akkermansiaceae bacterium]|jgi:hypothetical protein